MVVIPWGGVGATPKIEGVGLKPEDFPGLDDKAKDLLQEVPQQVQQEVSHAVLV